MTPSRSADPDPLEPRIERALAPGRFVRDDDSFAFVDDLEALATELATLTRTDPGRAAALHEAFLAGCYAKSDELHDSGALFGMFVQDLYCGWIKARQKARSDPEQTAARLLAWMDRDDHGYSHELEKVAAKVMNKATRTAFVRQVRARFEAATSDRGEDADRSRRAVFERRVWSRALRTLFAAGKDVAGYVAFAEETGLTADDCLQIAQLLVARKKPAEALPWVERGIAQPEEKRPGSLAAHELEQLRRELLVRLGRADEALQAAWTAFGALPSTFCYEDLMHLVPEAERADWHERAIAAAMGGHLGSVLDLLIATAEHERLAELVGRTDDDELQGLSHSITEPAAKVLDEPHPALAARLWRAQGLRIVDAGKSRYYRAAVQNFASSRRCFLRAGRADEWTATLARLRAVHKRKYGFMRELERVVAGSGPPAEPSFLERAKAKWRTREEER